MVGHHSHRSSSALCFPDIFNLEKQAQGLLHTVRMIEPVVVLSNHGNTGLLVLREMLRSFPQGESSVPDRFGSCFGGGNNLCVWVVRFRPPFPSGMRFGCSYSLSVGFPPYLASNLIQRLRRPLNDVEGIDAAFSGRSELVDAVRDPSGTVPSNDPYAG